ALLALVRTRGVINGGDTLIYAFGNEVSMYRGLRVDEHGGALMGYRAHIMRFPDQRFSILETCNLGNIDPGQIAHRIADIYLADRMTQPPPQPAAGRGRGAGTRGTGPSLTDPQLRAFAGDYYSEELDVTWHVALSEHHLMLR